MKSKFNRKGYLKSGGNICPHCGSFAISAGHISSEGREATQEVACQECKKNWVDVFVLTDVLEEEK
jgi:transposase-like protein